jgi:hypothetical protein
MCICLEIFKKVNAELPRLIDRTSYPMWLKFASTLCNRANEMQVQLQCNWFRYDKSLVKKLSKELYSARKIAMTVLENTSILDEDL